MSDLVSPPTGSARTRPASPASGRNGSPAARELWSAYAALRRPARPHASTDPDEHARRARDLLRRLASRGFDAGALSPDRLPALARVRSVVHGRVRVISTDDERFPADAIGAAESGGLAPERAVRIAETAARALEAFTSEPWSLPEGQPRAALEVRVVSLGGADRATHPAWRHVAIGAANAIEDDARATVRAVFEHLVGRALAEAGQEARPWDALVLGGSACAADWLLGAADGHLAAPDPARSFEDTPGVPQAGSDAAALWRALAEECADAANALPHLLRLVLGAACALPAEAPRARALAAALRWLGTTGAFDRMEGALARSATPFARHALLQGLESARGAAPTLARGAATGAEVDLAPYTAHVAHLVPDPASPWGVLRVTLRAEHAEPDALLQVARLGARGAVLGIARSEGARLEIDARALTGVVVVLSARAARVRGTLAVEACAPRALLEISAADRVGGVEHEVPVRGWTWRSCDVLVEDEAAPRAVPPRATRVRVRVRNRGDAPARSVAVRAGWQPARGEPVDDAWRPLLDADGLESEARLDELAAGAARWVALSWLPDASAEAVWIEVGALAESGEPAGAVTFAGERADATDAAGEARAEALCLECADFRALPPGLEPEQVLALRARVDGVLRWGAGYRVAALSDRGGAGSA